MLDTVIIISDVYIYSNPLVFPEEKPTELRSMGTLLPVFFVFLADITCKRAGCCLERVCCLVVLHHPCPSSCNGPYRRVLSLQGPGGSDTQLIREDIHQGVIKRTQTLLIRAATMSQSIDFSAPILISD